MPAHATESHAQAHARRQNIRKTIRMCPEVPHSQMHMPVLARTASGKVPDLASASPSEPRLQPARATASQSERGRANASRYLVRPSVGAHAERVPSPGPGAARGSRPETRPAHAPHRHAQHPHRPSPPSSRRDAAQACAGMCGDALDDFIEPAACAGMCGAVRRYVRACAGARWSACAGMCGHVRASAQMLHRHVRACAGTCWVIL